MKSYNKNKHKKKAFQLKEKLLSNPDEIKLYHDRNRSAIIYDIDENGDKFIVAKTIAGFDSLDDIKKDNSYLPAFYHGYLYVYVNGVDDSKETVKDYIIVSEHALSYPYVSVLDRSLSLRERTNIVIVLGEILLSDFKKLKERTNWRSGTTYVLSGSDVRDIALNELKKIFEDEKNGKVRYYCYCYPDDGLWHGSIDKCSPLLRKKLNEYDESDYEIHSMLHGSYSKDVVKLNHGYDSHLEEESVPFKSLLSDIETTLKKHNDIFKTDFPALKETLYGLIFIKDASNIFQNRWYEHIQIMNPEMLTSSYARILDFVETERSANHLTNHEFSIVSSYLKNENPCIAYDDDIYYFQKRAHVSNLLFSAIVKLVIAECLFLDTQSGNAKLDTKLLCKHYNLLWNASKRQEEFDEKYIEFGRNPFTLREDAKPLIWIVLDKTDNETLLLSEHIISVQQYDNKNNAHYPQNAAYKKNPFIANRNQTDAPSTWETCSLRKWLNNDFLNAAFSENERRGISQVSDANGISDTVSLLSEEEIHKYNKIINNSSALGTLFEEPNIYLTWHSPVLYWWLRSIATDGSGFRAMYARGYINHVCHPDGADVSTVGLGVRPIIRVKNSFLANKNSADLHL